MFKRKRIEAYLSEKDTLGLFDEILKLYASGELKKTLGSWGLHSVSLYVELWNDHKCLDVQAKCHAYFYEWQFEEAECSYMIYRDHEPDEPTCLQYSLFEDLSALLHKMKALIPKPKNQEGSK